MEGANARGQQTDRIIVVDATSSADLVHSAAIENARTSCPIRIIVVDATSSANLVKTAATENARIHCTIRITAADATSNANLVIAVIMGSAVMHKIFGYKGSINTYTFSLFLHTEFPSFHFDYNYKFCESYVTYNYF